MKGLTEQFSFEKEVESAIRSAFSELLERKHLYQNVSVDFGNIRSLITEVATRDFHGRFVIGSPTNPPTKKQIEDFIKSLEKQYENRINGWSSSEWILIDEATAKAFNGDEERIGMNRFAIPSINTFCSICDSGPWPHNLAHDSGTRGYAFESDENTANAQIFSLSFQCQNCKKEKREPLVFLVKRNGLKLILAGRSQFPEVSVPDFIPKELQKIFRNAVVANQVNFTLAAAMYLRTLVEQHFYQAIPKTEIDAIRLKGNPRGDELAELYAETLPAEFPSYVPSLRKAYDDLSEVMHRGDENDEASKKVLSVKANIEQHFEALKLLNSILKR